MDLYICEKPSQAKDLAASLGVSQRADGYFHNGNGKSVTWAFGHLLEQYMPDDYDPALKAWNTETLPIVPSPWKMGVKKSGAKQYKIIKGLLSKASTVYISTDYDREGEAIARELMEYCRFKGEVRRVCLTSLDPESISRALHNIKMGHETEALYDAQIARARADWLVGMNLSRLYTVLGRQTGFDQTLHIGRVITPTVALVAKRDNEIANFIPSPFYELMVKVRVQKGEFTAKWVCPEQAADEEGRCINKPFAEQVAHAVQGHSAVVSRAETKPGKESAPLPFDLTSLQQYASRRWGYTAQEVLDAAQSLYETHKATTYPRTDSRYLPESQRNDAPAILQSMSLTDPTFAGLCAGANPKAKARVFNDKKVTAHHAIIPTLASFDISKLNGHELNIYDAVRRFYLAQFYAPFEFLKSEIEVICQDHLFKATGKTPQAMGWKVLFQSDQESAPKDEGDDTSEQSKLPPVSQGEAAQIANSDLQSKMTRPSPHFTEASLLAAMENIARFVDEPRFKQILKDTSGLGTPATRAGIIEGAIQKGYLSRKNKLLLATPKAFALVKFVPQIITSPGMTAAWEQELEKIASGEQRLSVFMAQLEKWISGMVHKVKDNAAEFLNSDAAKELKAAGPSTHPCPKCGSDMKRIKGKSGFFWACQARDTCGQTLNDNRGKPEAATKTSKPGPECPECGGETMLRKSKARTGQDGKKIPASSFYGCIRFPDCKGIVKKQKRSTRTKS